MGMLLFMLLPVVAMAYIGWHVWCLLPVKWYVKTIVMTHLFARTLLYNNWWTAGGIAVFLFGLFLYGHLNYKHKVREELTITSQKVKKPFRAVLLSDLHLGYHNQRDELHRWVDIINNEKPDAILIAGDIIDGSMRPLKEQRMHEEFQRLQAPVYACLGNHEYFSGQPEARQFYKDAGIHLLMDSTAVIDSSLVIIGRDDAMNRRRKTLADLTMNIDKSLFSIVLDHQPHHLEKAEKAGIDFQFSGHTHRGQVCHLRVFVGQSPTRQHPLLRQ